MASSSPINTDQYFKTGAIVEISSNEEGFRGSLYLGTVIRPPGNAKRRTGKVLVEYKTIMEDDGARRGLREEIDVVELRPPPPTEVRTSYNLSDDVDAYYNEGWWEGVITDVKGNGKYSVFFRGTREQIDFKASQMRLHREWVYGKWIPPVEHVQSASPSKKPPSSSGVKSKKRKVEHEFSPGASVEVKSDEEGFQGAWFAATVLEKLTDGKYMVEYQNFKNEDDSKLTEKVNSQYMRPCPPDVVSVDSFTSLQEVDALHNDAWWVGEIDKVLEDDKYCVYFKITGEKLVFKHSDLRVHHEWIDGKWIVASKTQRRKQDAAGRLVTGRRCVQCQVQETPQWRTGSSGQTLCNACGVRLKSGLRTGEHMYSPVPIEASPIANSAAISEAGEISGTSLPMKLKPLHIESEANPTPNSGRITEATQISGTSSPEKSIPSRMTPQEANGGSNSGKMCLHCQVQETPQWRAGPLGPSTLCNACGVRFKKGRLFPEYRPASSPTFSPEVHSNSHQKVLKMRMQRSG